MWAIAPRKKAKSSNNKIREKILQKSISTLTIGNENKNTKPYFEYLFEKINDFQSVVIGVVFISCFFRMFANLFVLYRSHIRQI
jgi:hypothetical protein